MKLLLKCNNFIIDWAPKAACTIVTKQWFDQMGILEEALSYNPWVHCFREHVFYEKFGSVTTSHLESDDFIKIKYVRNPYSRAVSSYIHGCKFPGLFENFEKKNPSFHVFLQGLASGKLSINTGGNHWRIQNCYPKVKYDETIKIENLEPETKRLNKKYNLNLKCNFTSDHHVEKNDKIDNFFNTPASEVKNYLDENKIPEYDSFYNEEVINMVYEIYKTDIETYNYKPPLYE